MHDNEFRGIILEALYNQRRRDLVDFETELGKLPLPDGAMESILRQLEKKGLIERPFRPLSGLGKGRITAYGIDVAEKTTSPPLSILFQQHIEVQDSSDVQIGTGNMQNLSDIKKMNTAVDHSQASQDAPKTVFGKNQQGGDADPEKMWIEPWIVGTEERKLTESALPPRRKPPRARLRSRH